MAVCLQIPFWGSASHTRIDAGPSGPANAIEFSSVILIADRPKRTRIIGGLEFALDLRSRGILTGRKRCPPALADLDFVEDMVAEEQQSGPRARAEKSDRGEEERQGGLRQLAVRKPESHKRADRKVGDTARRQAAQPQADVRFPVVMPVAHCHIPRCGHPFIGVDVSIRDRIQLFA